MPIAVILLVWGVFIAGGAIGSIGDNLRRGKPAHFPDELAIWFFDHVLLIVLTCALHELFRRRPQLLASRRSVALMFAALLLFFLPFQVLLQSYMGPTLQGKPAPVGVLTALTEVYRMHWFFEACWASFTFVAVVSVCIWRDARVRQQAWMQAQAENLSLRLELEQQRMLALRGQLNPHFLFNALNAISALVRSHDGKLALAGIGHLSDLLRYALAASERDHVSLIDERQFVADYLALQKMRYGARLQVHIVGDDGHGLAGEVPPLLLQPLIENALRHDLDCHEGPSDIELAFGGDDERLTISVSNPLNVARSTNPGLGLGLRHSRARLQLAYGAAATLSAGPAGGRFVVDIVMPRHALPA